MSELPTAVDATPAGTIARLRSRLLPVKSVWFPTRAELREWEHAGVPLYVRVVGSKRFEVGPRLASLWAACFAPVWVGRASDDEAGATTITWSRRWPRFTSVLLMGWWAVLVAWPIALWASPDPDEAGRWLVFWAFLVFASTVGPAGGRWAGGRALDEALPWLRDALLQPDVDESW